MTAHEDERSSLARDLHDGVGQTLTAVVLTLDAAEASLPVAPERRRPDRIGSGGAIRRARVLALARSRRPARSRRSSARRGSRSSASAPR